MKQLYSKYPGKTKAHIVSLEQHRNQYEKLLKYLRQWKREGIQIWPSFSS